MRYSGACEASIHSIKPLLVPVAGILLGLRALGVAGSIICDPEQTRGVNATSTFVPSAKVLGHCIEDICTTGGNAGSISNRCGPVLLSINHLGAPISHFEDCVSQLHGIFDQCIAASGAHGGISQTHEVVYDVSITGQNGEEEEVNEQSDGFDDNERTPIEEVKYPTHEARRGRGGRSKTRPKTRPNTRPKTTPKKNSTRPKTKPQKDTQACPLPDKKGKNGKGQSQGRVKQVIRDVAEVILPETLHKAIFPRGCAPTYTPSKGCGLVQNQSVQREMAQETTEDPQCPEDPGSHASWSQLDVVKIRGGRLEVVGNQNGGIRPADGTRRSGSYILCNGAFFKTDDPNNFFPIGRTSSTTNYLDPDSLYAPYYERIAQGNEFLESGPSLLRPLPLANQEFKYWRNIATKDKWPHAEVPGNLAHAGSQNERLVLGKFGNSYYLFAYTSQRVAASRPGVDLNQMRDIIHTFMRSYFPIFVHFDQLTNLDGGGSVFMSWTERRTGRMIAQGGKGDLTPPNPPPRHRHVTNVLKIRV
ncbi:hypothetical protein BU23DRAFT_639151 [Bimuria novae-zelandiae CBS 107.79]|uniref:Uncharacterized protein n=1 Tax=Bimuria novae-zelandiae CBS 107.79 TaxID=1447943 RepID=A0A6A5V914_9PLEO|nr:hypothetical protein BU23DRAFT_639151 [Bimuria novae-zelandiae CBS 107.79]